MSVFVLVSGDFQILDTAFEGDYHLSECVLGGRFEMDEEQARRSVLHGAALVPLSTFESLGFTPEELKAYPNPRFHPQAPPEFLAKHARAIEAFHAYRADQLKEEAA